MKTKIRFGRIQEEIYEKIYPLICEVMEEFGYDKRSPNWWSGTPGKNISTHLIKEKSLKLAICVFEEIEFKSKLRVFMRLEWQNE